MKFSSRNTARKPWARLGACAMLVFCGFATAQGSRQNLILNGDFEGNSLSQFGGKEALSHEIRVVTSPVRSGRHAARIEVNEDEYGEGGGKWRAELTNGKAGGANQERERWFGFSTYLPNDWKNDSKTDIIFQIHEKPDDCEDWRSPPLYLRVSGDKMQWQSRWDSKKCSNGNTPEGTAQIVSRPIVKGRWVDWVAHVKWSYGSDGLVEIWQDGTKIATRNGPNAYNDDREMYLKVGNYKLAWGDGLTQRVHYVDEVRMGNGNASYADVAPGGGSTSPTPSPTPTPTPTPPPSVPPAGDVPIGMTVVMRAVVNGKLVDASNTDDALEAQGNNVGSEDRFEVVGNSDGTVSLKSVRTNRFVAVHPTNRRLFANASTIGTAAKFEWDATSSDTNQFTLRSISADAYVSADDAGADPLVANRQNAQSWEQFVWEEN